MNIVKVVHNAAGNFISPTERLSANAFQTILDIVLKVCSLSSLAIIFKTLAFDREQPS